MCATGGRQPTWNFNDKARLLDRLVSKPINAELRNNPSFIREFLVLLAVCHTVIPERDRVHPASALVARFLPNQAD